MVRRSKKMLYGVLVTKKDIAKLESPKIVFCQCTYGARAAETEVCIRTVRPYVDRIVIIHPGNMSDNFMKWAAEEMDAELYEHPWVDNFPGYRNRYIDHAGEGWLLVSDPDEVFDVLFLQDLRGIINKSQMGTKFNMLKINSHDVMHYPDMIEEHASEFYKALCFKWAPNIKYLGIAVSKNVHETLEGAGKPVQLLQKYLYRHCKTPSGLGLRAPRKGASEVSNDCG